MDCRLCFYYTWEQRLLCAVEPSLVGNACECRHYDYAPNFVENGVVVREALDLGYARAVQLPYEWEDHYEGGLVKAMVVISYDAMDLGFAVAVALPYEWEDHYEGGLVKAMIVVSQGVGNRNDGWFRPAVELPTSCYLNELLLEDYNFSSERNFVDGVVIGHSLWRDRQNGRVVGYAQAWLIEYRDWYQNPDPLSLEGGFVLELMSLFNS